MLWNKQHTLNRLLRSKPQVKLIPTVNITKLNLFPTKKRDANVEAKRQNINRKYEINDQNIRLLIA